MLDTPREPQFDALVELAAAACEAPIALVSLVDRDRQWFKASVGIEGLRETPRSLSFCSHAIEEPALMEIPDATVDDRFRSNPLVTGPPHIRFYAGVPLEVSGGHRLGTLCVVDIVPRRLTSSQSAALTRLAGLAVHIIETRPGGARREPAVAPPATGDGDSAASATLESLQNAVVVSDTSGRVTFMNQAAETLTQWPRAEALNDAVGRVFRLEDSIAGRTADELVHYAIARAESCSLPYSVVLRRRDGSQLDIETSVTPIADASGKVKGAVVAFGELKEASREAVRLAHLAQRDALTELPNRVLLYDRVAQAITAARRRGSMVALLFVDLDGFKAVNDTYGHALGDRLLKAVAGRLAQAVRAADTVSRFGGDEFVVLLPEVDGPDAVAAFAKKVIDCVRAPYVLQNHGVELGVSVGVSMFPLDADDPDGLIEAADEAMYHAKRAGGNRHRFFTRGMTTALARQTRVEHNVRRALESGAYVTLYQPWISLSDGAVGGFGLAFARQRADGGHRRAMSEIEFGRSIMLAYDIGRWTLQTACTARQALGAGGPRCPVAFGVNGVTFRAPDFVHLLERAVLESGTASEDLVLCVSESDVMHDLPRSRAILSDLKGLGVRVALAGDGSGTASLDALCSLPIAALHVPVAGHGPAAAAYVAVGRTNGIPTVATGVDGDADLRWARERGFDAAQGRWIHRPVSRETALQWRTTDAAPRPWNARLSPK